MFKAAGVGSKKALMNNFSLRISTPDGDATIIIVESNPGNIENIFYFIGKQGSSLNAWAYAFSQMVVSAIKSKGISKVIAELDGITVDRQPSRIDIQNTTSGPSAICNALKAYHASIYPTDSYYRPPSINTAFRGYRNYDSR